MVARRGHYYPVSSLPPWSALLSEFAGRHDLKTSGLPFGLTEVFVGVIVMM